MLTSNKITGTPEISYDLHAWNIFCFFFFFFLAALGLYCCTEATLGAVPRDLTAVASLGEHGL